MSSEMYINPCQRRQQDAQIACTHYLHLWGHTGKQVSGIEIYRERGKIHCRQTVQDAPLCTRVCVIMRAQGRKHVQ